MWLGYGYLRQQFADGIRPTTISFSMRCSGDCSVFAENPSGQRLFEVNACSGMFVTAHGLITERIYVSTDTWFRYEISNIDWDNAKFDFRMQSLSSSTVHFEQRGLDFNRLGSSIRTLTLHTWDADKAAWDDIMMY